MSIIEAISKVLRWENAEYNVEFPNLKKYCEYQKCKISNFHNDLRQALMTMRAKQEIQDFCISDSRISIFR